MFKLQYEPFAISDNLSPWEIAFVPWDAETFGFGVSALNPCYDEKYTHEAGSLEKALEMYSKCREVNLITASIPAEKGATSLLLQRSGFRFIDLSLQISYENSANFLMPNTMELTVVPATANEIGVLVDMAGCSFQHGRYHQDRCLLRSLADQRYRDWVRRCLDPENPQELLAVKLKNAVCGFSVVEHKGKEGYLHLHAIDSKWQGRHLGADMILQSLRYLYKSGAQRVGTKISASNLRALNMHSRLQGRFIETEYLLHWHRRGKE